MSNRPPRHAWATNKGGGNKTTLCLQWASAAARAGHTVAVVDFDSQGNLTHRLRAENTERAYIGDVLHLHTPQPITNALTTCGWETPATTEPHPEAGHIYVIQSDLTLAEREHETHHPAAIYRLRKALDALPCEQLGIEAIGIDFSPHAGHLMHMGLAALNHPTDRLWLPVTPDRDEIDGALRVAGFVGENRDVLGIDHLTIGGVIVSSVNRQLRHAAQYIQGMQETFSEADNGAPVHVMNTLVPSMSVVRYANSERVPLDACRQQYRRSAEAITVYDTLYQEMQDR